MVHEGSRADYPNRITSAKNAESGWTEAIRAAVGDFVNAVRESSLQLANAVERFTTDSVRTVNLAAESARSSAATSAEMATAASQAAAEARRAAGGVSETSSYTDQTERIIESLKQTADDAIERLRQESQAAGQQFKTDVMKQTHDAVEQIRRAASIPDAAPAAGMPAGRAGEGAAAPSVSQSVQDVLERLEADYRLIAQLVQELNGRISSLHATSLLELEKEPLAYSNLSHSGRGPADVSERETIAPALELEAAPAAQVSNERSSLDVSWEPEQEPVATEEVVLDSPPMPGVQDDSWPADSVQDLQEESAFPETGQAKKVAGRMLITIAPVPDFDRLLNLDSALGSMQGIASVSLADYAKQEVTFRLEVESPMTADDFARSLGESTGNSASVATVEEGKLALRLAS